MELLLLFLFIALGVSFLCSILESVLLSVTPGFVGAYEKSSPKTGRLLRRLKDDVDRPLAAVLSLNTMAHTIGAAGVGAQALVIFGSGYVAITSVILTLLILFVSEIIPKTLGAVYWRRLAPFTARTLRVLVVVLYPLVIISMGLTRLIAKRRIHHFFSHEEFQAIAEIGAQEGELGEQESRVIENLFLLRELRAGDVMTPRTVLFTLPADTTVAEVVAKYPDIRFSRIPIYGEDPDDVMGLVLKDDVYVEASRGDQGKALASLRRDMTVVSETIKPAELLERLSQNRQHAALVVDEHGGVSGIVTMEDVIETLLGVEIMDETDAVADMRALARQQWLRRARAMGITPADEE